MIIIIVFLHFWGLALSAASDTKEAIIRRDLNFTGLVKYDGYESETHKVATIDGYILTLFRVTSPNCKEQVGSEPILFMHGLFLSGADCIIPGPAGSHCYEYANACRDVWVPNSRGTVYSLEHNEYNSKKDSKYWDFSFDDMALYDMPAIIDYILEKTGKKQITYVGHAQGVTLLLVLCSEKPEYNDKISVGFGLSPTAWLDHCRFIVIKLAGLLSKVLTLPIEAGLKGEFLPQDGVYQPFVKLLCGTTDLSFQGCSALYYSVLGYDNKQISENTMKTLTGHLPGGTSLKNFIRWGQIFEGGFTKYDHGTLGNMMNYGSLKPPAFALDKITMKWILIDSKNDYVSDERDVDTLMSKMSVEATKCIVSDESFGHLDYLYGKDVPVLITPMILAYLDTGQFECL